MTSRDSALISSVLLGKAAEVPGAIKATEERREQQRLDREREEALRRLPVETRQSLLHVRVAIIALTPLLVALAYLLPYSLVELRDVGWSALICLGTAAFLCLVDWAGGRLVLKLGASGGLDVPRDPVGRLAAAFLACWIVMSGLLIWRADGFPTHESWPLILGLGAAALFTVYAYACLRVASDMRGTWACLAIALVSMIAGTGWANQMVLSLKEPWNARSASLAGVAGKSLDTKRCKPVSLPGSPEERSRFFGQARCRMGKMTITVTGARSVEDLRSMSGKFHDGKTVTAVSEYDSCGSHKARIANANWVFRLNRNRRYIGQLYCSRGRSAEAIHVEVGRVILENRRGKNLGVRARPNIATTVTSRKAHVGRMTRLLPKIKMIERNLDRKWN